MNTPRRHPMSNSDSLQGVLWAWPHERDDTALHRCGRPVVPKPERKIGARVKDPERFHAAVADSDLVDEAIRTAARNDEIADREEDRQFARYLLTILGGAAFLFMVIVLGAWFYTQLHSA